VPAASYQWFIAAMTGLVSRVSAKIGTRKYDHDQDQRPLPLTAAGA
jgi:hypothetical protein